MTPEEIQKKRDRIAKLMNMTTANGCTEDEAISAMSMAAGLAASIGIALDDIRPVDAPKRKMKESFNGAPMKVHEALAGEAAATLYGVEFNAPNYGKNGYWFIGREENIELAQTTMLWLIRQVEMLYKTHLPRGLTQKARAEFRATFKQSCSLRVLDRSTALMRDMMRNDATASAATGSTALVVAGHFQQLKSELQDYWDERMGVGKYAKPLTERQLALIQKNKDEAAQLEADYRSGKKKRPKEKPIKFRRGRSIKFGNGTEAGFTAGDTVQLRKELN